MATAGQPNMVTWIAEAWRRADRRHAALARRFQALA
jgi:hypothetical protein